ncbi:MAG: hypothetical protein JWP63_3056 [Candidatus Solibacter sp.]|jgi:predicted HTH domain antitoxin|nr:hypothetical protein [Candidatus Solibacter sp.]
MKLEFELELPDNAVIALKLYSEERLTTGEAAEMLGLTLIQFLDLLGRSNVGFSVELDDEDLAQIRRWREEQTGRRVPSFPTVAR